MTIAILLLQTLPPFTLGPYGSAALTIVAIILGFITWRQRTWKSTADAAIAEMKVHKEANDRLRAENTRVAEEKVELAKRVATLQAQTDLKPLIDAISSWITEGRARFDEANRRLDGIHAEQTAALKVVMEEIKAQRLTSEDSYRALTQAFMTHTMEDHQHQLDNKQVNLQFVSMMDSVERRLSEVAVQIGLHQWKPAAAEARASQGT